MKQLKNSLQEHLNDKSGEIIRSGVKIAIIGAPNAGKSTLINLLTKRDIAIVSDIAGTTRDSIEIDLNLFGHNVKLIDTAGLRAETNDEIEKIGINRSKERAGEANLKLCLFSPDYNNEDIEFVNSYIDEKTIVIFNKIDKAENNLIQNAVNISAKDGDIQLLMNELKMRLDEMVQPAKHPSLTRSRHRNYLNRAINDLEEFIYSFENNIDIVLTCENLRMVAKNIGNVTGAIDVEDLLDEIFSSFCIGK